MRAKLYSMSRAKAGETPAKSQPSVSAGAAGGGAAPDAAVDDAPAEDNLTGNQSQNEIVIDALNSLPLKSTTDLRGVHARYHDYPYLIN